MNGTGCRELCELNEGTAVWRKIRGETNLASAEIYLYGAQVTSWKPAGFEEVLFVSKESHWQMGKAIRGGIPVCFPWFRGKADDKQAPTHGLVRTKEWRLDSVQREPDDSISVRLSTESDSATRRLVALRVSAGVRHHVWEKPKARVEDAEYRAIRTAVSRGVAHVLQRG